MNAPGAREYHSGFARIRKFNPAKGKNLRRLSWAESGVSEEHRQLTEEVYRTLRALARRQLRREMRVVTLESAALVHEAWMRMAGDPEAARMPRPIFLAIAARVMRQVLVDAARARARLKRQPVPVAEASLLSEDQSAQILGVHQALERLERADGRKCRVVEMRFFGGCSVEETAESLGVSANTVHNDWAFARRWLARHLRAEKAIWSPNETSA